MAEVGSTLEDACERYAGRILLVEPQNGHGWFHQGEDVSAARHWVPPPFHVQVVRVYAYAGERRGILARIVEAGFKYDGFWLVSMTRHKGVWNFTDRPATYNLLMCPEEPVEGREEESPGYGKLWPVWHLRGFPHASGFGVIGEDPAAPAAG